MHICLYSNVFLPSVGGYQQVSATLAGAFKEAGHRVTLVTPTPAEAGYDAQFSFPVVRRSHEEMRWPELLNDVDIIVSMGASLHHIFAWWRSGRPIVYIHGTYLLAEPEFATGPIHWVQLQFGWALRRALLKLAASHVYYSKAMQDVIRVGPAEVIYNPVDPVFRLMPDVAREADFGFFGRLVIEKGVGTLLDALAITNKAGRRFTVHVYGEGNYEAEARSKAEALGLSGQVEFKGFKRGDDLARAMNAVDVVVMPSLWKEPLGMVAVEAMTCGRTVIGSSGGGLGEVIGEHGLTFPNGDAAALAARMLLLFEDPQLKARLERSGLEYASQFTTRRVVEKYIANFDRALARRRRT